MRILGIDPGLRTTGFGVIDCDGAGSRYVASGTISTAAVAMADLPGRLKVIFDGVREVTARYAPTCASVEIVFVNVNPQSTLLLGQARGAALTALVADELAVAEYTALQMKQRDRRPRPGEEGTGAGDGHAPARAARRAGQGRGRRARPGDLPRPRRGPLAAIARSVRPRAAHLRALQERANLLILRIHDGLGRRRAGVLRRQSAPHVCPLRRRRQVPRRPRDDRGRHLDADRARLRASACKVKAANVLLRFEQPAARRRCCASAEAIAREIDLDLAWEFAPEGEFGFADLARDYFDAKAGVDEAGGGAVPPVRGAALLPPPRQGAFRKAPEEIVKAALLGIERKTPARGADRCVGRRAGRRQVPAAGARAALQASCSSPTRTRPSTRRSSRRRAARRRAPLDLLKSAGAIDSPYQFHWRRFLFEEFPKGTGFAGPPVPPVHRGRCRCRRRRRSRSTTRRPPRSTTRCRCRASAAARSCSASTSPRPAWRSRPTTPLDKVARERLSTVYMPGYKLTMLPDDVVQAYTLTEGRDCPAVSLYVTFDEATLAIMASETRLERVPIAANLRHDQLDERDHRGDARPARRRPTIAFAAELAFAFRLARNLKAQREMVRGKPENFNRPDYNFRLEGDGRHREPDGNERVSIDAAPARHAARPDRRRGDDPGQQHLGRLARRVRRARASTAARPASRPGVKVRMGTQPAPHAGMGVAQYTWATSPLRRYVDLVNQWQIIACARARPHARRWPRRSSRRTLQLFSIISGFDAAYAAYNGFQAASSATGRCAGSSRTTSASSTRDRDEGRPGARRHAAAGVPRARRRAAAARQRACACASPAIDLLTLDVHASVVARARATTAPLTPRRGRRRRRRQPPARSRSRSTSTAQETDAEADAGRRRCRVSLRFPTPVLDAAGRADRLGRACTRRC